MNEIVIKNAENVAIEISPSALAERDVIITAAQQIVLITDEVEQGAVTVLSRVNGTLKGLEASRKLVKAPVIELGRKIDRIADEFAAALNGEKVRIGRLLSDHEESRRKAREEAARKILEEQQRIEAEQRKIEAEKQRVFEEEQKRLAKLKSEAGRQRAEEQAAQRQAELDTQNRRLEAERLQKLNAPLPVAPPKTVGSVSRDVWKFEVVDISKLHAHSPHLVALSPKAQEINRTISAGAREIPGLRIWKEIVVGARSS